MSSRWTIPLSSPGDQNRIRVGSETEPIVQVGPAGRELVAGAAASAIAAEYDIVRGSEAVRSGSGKASGSAGVHCARPTTNTEGTGVAVGDRGDLGRAGNEWIDRLADEGELGVGVGDPVRHLLMGHDVRRRLHDYTVPVSSSIVSTNRGMRTSSAAMAVASTALGCRHVLYVS